MSKINLAILIGGKSPEHAISLRSGKSVIDALDRSKYELFIIGIDNSGQWYLLDENDYLIDEDNASAIRLRLSTKMVALENQGQAVLLMDKATLAPIQKIDVAFPVLHGAYGEDGVIQGLFRTMNIPFVGVDVLASAIGMDKEVSKRLWRDAGIPIAKFMVVKNFEKNTISYQDICDTLGDIVFVKPANAGSSVGVHKVTNRQEFDQALEDGFLYDRKLLIEEAIEGIEVECAILGNEFPKASVVGAILPTENFYSYDAKYISTTGATTQIPADIPEMISDQIRELAIKAFQCISGEGLSRVDFFLKADHSIVINEINTLPGFTNISMYPKLWQATGLSYAALLDALIQLAIDRHRQTSQLKTNW